MVLSSERESSLRMKGRTYNYGRIYFQQTQWQVTRLYIIRAYQSNLDARYYRLRDKRAYYDSCLNKIRCRNN